MKKRTFLLILCLFVVTTFTVSSSFANSFSTASITNGRMMNDTMMILQTVNCDTVTVYSDYAYAKVKKFLNRYTSIKNYVNTSRDNLFIKYHREYPKGDNSIWEMFEDYPVNYLVIITYRQTGWSSCDGPPQVSFNTPMANMTPGYLEITSLPFPFMISLGDDDESYTIKVEIQLDFYDVTNGKKIFSMYDYNNSEISDQSLSKEIIYNIEEVLKDFSSIFCNPHKWLNFKKTRKTQTD